MPLSEESFRSLCRARLLLSGDAQDPQTVRQIARAVHMSTFHFIRQFEALFGATPHQFRIQSRLDQAKLLLAMGEQSITDVCMQVGMSSVGSFSHLFSRRTGTSPSTFQSRARKVMVQVPSNYPEILFPGCFSMMGRLPADAFRNFREAPNRTTR